MADQTTILVSEPGIKRDGTKFEGNNYVDGQWVRWQRGLPRKIAGYKTTLKTLAEIVVDLLHLVNNYSSIVILVVLLLSKDLP